MKKTKRVTKLEPQESTLSLADRCVEVAIQTVIEDGMYADLFDPMYDEANGAPLEELIALVQAPTGDEEMAVRDELLGLVPLEQRHQAERCLHASKAHAYGQARVAFALGVAFGRRMGNSR